jgi:hypothetical protein
VPSTGAPVPVATTPRPAAVANPAAGFGVLAAPRPPGPAAGDFLLPDRDELEAMLAWAGPAAMPPPAPPPAPAPAAAEPPRAATPVAVLPLPPAGRADFVPAGSPAGAEAPADPAAAPLPLPVAGPPPPAAPAFPVAPPVVPAVPPSPAPVSAPTAGANTASAPEEATVPRDSVPAPAPVAFRPDAAVPSASPRPLPGVKTPPANPAAPVAAMEPAVSRARSNAEKNPASAEHPSVKVERFSAGTGVALSAPDMRPALTDSSLLPLPAAVTVELQETVATKADTPALAAHRAVAAVVELLDAQAAAREPAAAHVALRLQVGDEELAVRIELRDGEVRTEFRTASPELRAALAHEWRATVARADLPVRLADPAFTGGETRPDLSGGGHGTPQHGQSGSRPAPPPSAEVFGAVGRRYPAAVAAAAPLTPLVPANRLLSAVA